MDLSKILDSKMEEMKKMNEELVRVASETTPKDLCNAISIALKALILQHQTVVRVAQEKLCDSLISESAGLDTLDDAQKALKVFKAFSIDTFALSGLLSSLSEMDFDFPSPPENEIQESLERSFLKFRDAVSAGKINETHVPEALKALLEKEEERINSERKAGG